MRVLFLESHPMWIYGLPNGFRDAGHEVKISGPLTNDNIPKIISSFCPELIITMGWGPEHADYKQEWIRKYVKASGLPHIYWATEDPTHTQVFSLPYIKKVEPDYVFTICPSTIQYYHSLGIRAAHLDFGFHAKVHYPTDIEPQYRSEIAVVANAYPNHFIRYPEHYRLQSIRNLICPVLQAKIRIDFWGRQWDKMESYLGQNIPEEWLHGYLDYTEANKVYSSAKIVIGLQNHLTQLTQRIYEILGSGGFLLTNDTPEIRRLFEPGKDLAVTTSPQETVSLIRYYLQNPEEREKIRRQGRTAVVNHSYCNRAKYIMDVLQTEGILKTPAALAKNCAPSALIVCGNKNYKKIAFTYDAGGDVARGKEVLDVLKYHGVKSTFFLTGKWVEQFPDLAKQIAVAGHEIGNHSFSHPDFTQLTSDEILQQITDCDTSIARIIGKPASRLFRPPFGAYNKRVLHTISDAGYKYTIYWSLDTLDWKQLSAEEILGRILNNVQNGDIVLMHIAGDNTAIVTDQAISELKRRDYKLVTVTELLKEL